jgi:hypothetical protein
VGLRELSPSAESALVKLKRTQYEQMYRFALKLGHCSMRSACLKGANLRNGMHLLAIIGVIANVNRSERGTSTFRACRIA